MRRQFLQLRQLLVSQISVLVPLVLAVRGSLETCITFIATIIECHLTVIPCYAKWIRPVVLDYSISIVSINLLDRVPIMTQVAEHA